MKSPNALYIQDIFSEIVESVSSEMTPYLKTLYPQITGVHFQYGTGYEIIETLNQMSQNDANVDKYPLVCLFLDVDEEFGTSPGIYSNIPRLRVAVVNDTDSTLKAVDRDIKQFKPILTPIYQCLLRVMSVRGDVFQGMGNIDNLRHNAKRNYFWGREGVYGKEGAIFNDKLDAIEIEFINLKINSSYCPKEAV